MREAAYMTLNALRWPRWLQNILLLIAAFPAAVWLGKFTISHPDLLLQFGIVLLVLLPGLVLVSIESPKLVAYVIFIWFIGPGIRRVADWMVGYYSEQTLLSLLPVCTTSLLFLTFLRRPLSLDKPTARVLKAYLLPFVMASAIGLLVNKLAGIYGIANYMAPLLIAVYMAAKLPDERQKESWIRTFVTLAVLLSIYGWFQYLYLPPWDEMWMRGAQMVSLGPPEPMMFRIFSTVNSTGTFAVLLVAALIPSIMNRRWRGPFGWIGVALMVSALSLTLVRASWVTLVVGIVVYLLLASGVSRLRMILIVGTLTLIGTVVFPYLPGGANMADRLSTFSDLQNDNSANVRWGIVLHTIPELIKQPLGAGLGGIGKSTALNGGEGAFSSLGSVDNGYLGVFATFGLLGGYLFFRAVTLHWKYVLGTDRGSVYRALGLLTLVNLLVSFLFGGELAQFNALIYWLYTGMAFVKQPAPANE